MEPYYRFLNRLVTGCEEEASDFGYHPVWIGSDKAAKAENKRTSLLYSIETKLKWEFKNTKPWIHNISDGCIHCGNGQWSCLFITGRCNASCFYCPTSQNGLEVPETQSLLFSDPADYVAYLKHFNFKAVGISGGEPLLVPDLVLKYLTTIRETMGNSIYIWLYTNGIAGNRQIFSRLAIAGLNEIRFDAGASGYNTGLIAEAKGIIPVITVEIPAIPEDIPVLKDKIAGFIGAGVKNLNLHHLRITKYNSEKMKNRNYSLLHGEKPTIMESELAALEIMKYVAKNHPDLGVNYCSFHFKNRFQKAGYRRKIARRFAYPGEEITEIGYLRTIRPVPDNGIPCITLEELKGSNKSVKAIELSYRAIILKEPDSRIERIDNWILGNKAYMVREGLILKEVIEGKEIEMYLDMLNKNPNIPPVSEKLFRIWQCELIETGLREYF